MIPTLRTLTKKSKLGFGKFKDETVQRILDLKKPLELISAYYKLSSINFTDDILLELKITDEFKLQKPCINLDLYYEFLEQKGFKKKIRVRTGSNAMKKETRLLSKSELRSFNQKK